MKEEKLAVDEASEGKAVEHIHRDVIGFLAVLAETFMEGEVHSVLKLK